MRSRFALAMAGGVLLALLCPGNTPSATPNQLAAFRQPPVSAQPWVYWFWLNGNITSNGISADLEAMKRVGIGGALIMEVDQGAPLGPVPFMGPDWRQLFKHVVAEAKRLNLEINMNNDAGWNGSGGPWIEAKVSMQKLVWTETPAEGNRSDAATLAQPSVVHGFYRDIAVLAFPTPGAFRIPNIQAKAGFEAAYVAPGLVSNAPAASVISLGGITNLTSRMDANGRLAWDTPPGQWTILRFGATSTGMENAPAPVSGRGLECDKLSKAGIESNFAGMMAKLVADSPSEAGKALAATHIDSWENGAQNWTEHMRDEFRRRRGYDPVPMLAIVTGRVVGSLDISERFLWDLRKTISELVIENYAEHMGTLAHQRGLRLSIEAYGGPCEDLPYAGRADEPMCEFWIGGGAFNTVKGMASAAHTYGKRILGAEAFTAADQEKWLEYPGSIKALGDRAFCEGVNRFVFHRYALQPWPEVRLPGMTMGPWGLHYERTQTWWEWSLAWHQYLARCQWLLRQGLFVADFCFLQPEAAPQDFHAHELKGYAYDECSAETVLTQMAVKDGRLILPDGMSYTLLVLPDVPTMTPALLRKLTTLVEAGGTIVGTPPRQSPSLADYPSCDEDVSRLASQLWGDCDGERIKQRRLGLGRVVRGISPEQLLRADGRDPDFTSHPALNFIHRTEPNREIYFVANPRPHEVQAVCSFRVKGKVPEVWAPDTGEIEPAPLWEESGNGIQLPLRLGPAGSLFVVFETREAMPPAFRALRHNGQLLQPTAAAPKPMKILSARYGVLSDPARTRDVQAEVQRRIDQGAESLPVAQFALGGDPAQGTAKEVQIEYATGGGHVIKVVGRDSETIHLPEDAAQVVVQRARYGVLNDPVRTRDVRARMQALIDRGEFGFQVARMAEGDDPAFLVVKTLEADYTVNGKQAQIRGTDPETIQLVEPSQPPIEQVGEIHCRPDGSSFLRAWQAGTFEIQTASGRQQTLEVSPLPSPLALAGPWTVRFPANSGAPSLARFDTLLDWSKHADNGIRYFSGSATYHIGFTLSADQLKAPYGWQLDLGRVAVMAQVRLNQKNLGILWKPPYEVDATDAVHVGDNDLEIQVVNLWVNRLIGDEQLPEDCDRNADGTLKRWPEWLERGQPSPSGRFTFTSWRLWKKDSPLQPSGLIGPVVMRCAQRLDIK
ncbi:MAG: glycosyl hydrolase [Verrucomicrobiota bacterium]